MEKKDEKSRSKPVVRGSCQTRRAQLHRRRSKQKLLHLDRDKSCAGFWLCLLGTNWRGNAQSTCWLSLACRWSCGMYRKRDIEKLDKRLHLVGFFIVSLRHLYAVCLLGSKWTSGGPRRCSVAAWRRAVDAKICTFQKTGGTHGRSSFTYGFLIDSLEYVFYFPLLGIIPIPTDYFSEGLKPPTTVPVLDPHTLQAPSATSCGIPGVAVDEVGLVDHHPLNCGLSGLAWRNASDEHPRCVGCRVLFYALDGKIPGARKPRLRKGPRFATNEALGAEPQLLEENPD